MIFVVDLNHDLNRRAGFIGHLAYVTILPAESHRPWSACFLKVHLLG